MGRPWIEAVEGRTVAFESVMVAVDLWAFELFNNGCLIK
jgi:hypothetical protein